MSTLARNTDPETSHQAAESVHVAPSVADVLDTLNQYGPKADHQLVALMQSLGFRHTPQRIRTARSTLERDGKVIFTGDYATTPNGRNARVWGVTR